MNHKLTNIPRITTTRLTTFLSFIFFFSGFSALIYQVVWQRLLTLHYGVGEISITLIVSIYMVGLGLGALFGGYLADRIINRIILYFGVELLIGIFGIISLPLLKVIGRHTAGSSYELSFLYIFLFLCLPTFLMGITLPVLTKIFNRLINDFLSSVSFLYFINTLGASLGTIFATYFLISFFGLDVAVAVAVVINFVMATLIFLVRDSAADDNVTHNIPVSNVDRDAIFGNLAYLLVFITGFVAIGYEIIWFRIIGVLVKASPYAFSSVLSIYLLGIAVGSFGMSKYLHRHKNIHKKSLFFSLQFLIGISVIITFVGYYYLTKYTSFRELTNISFGTVLHPKLVMPSFGTFKRFLVDLYRLFDVFWWSAFFVLIPTILMGASFPLISLLSLSHRNKEGSTVGTVYFFNIVGNVFGGLITGFLLLPFLKTEKTVLIFSLIGVIFVIFVSRFRGKQVPLNRRIVFATILLIIIVILFPMRGQFYKTMHSWKGEKTEIYLEEGVEGVVVTYKQQNKVKNFINGLGHGGRPGYSFYYETLEALSFASNLENVLIIGFGTGSIVEMIQKSDDVQNITLVELNKTLLKNLRKMNIFVEILDNPKVNTIIDDGRRFLLRTNKKFDLIAIDPVRTTTFYSNNLYSCQFFELVNEHLSDDGIFLIWTDEYKVMPNTVHSVFDHVRLYNSFMLASNAPFEKYAEREKQLLAQFSPKERELILSSGKYVGDQSYIIKEASHYPINKDWKPVTEYYLGLKFKEKFFLDR